MPIPVITAEQTIWINGVEAHGRDCRVRRGTDSRVTDIQLVVEEGLAGYDQVSLGASLEIQHTYTDSSGTAQTLTEKGEIASFDYVRIGGDHTSIKIQGKGEEVELARYRIYRRWEETAAGQIVADAVAELSGFSSSVATGPTITELESDFDSIFDILEDVCKRTGYAWRSVNSVVHFFNPETEQGPDVTQDRMVRDTLNYSKSGEQISNVIFIQAYEFRDQQRATYTVKAKQIIEWTSDGAAIWGECLNKFGAGTIPGENSSWEVYSDPYVYSPSRYYDGVQPKDWIGASIDFEQQEVKLEEQIVVEAGEFVVVRYNLRRPVWIERRHETSISSYGERHGSPISEQGGWGIEEATAYADEILKRQAWPSFEASVDVIDPGHDCDTVAQVTHSGIGVDRLMYVKGMDRQWADGVLSVSLELAGLDTNPTIRPSTASIDPIKESLRRIERLERRDSHTTASRGRVTSSIGNIAGAEKYSADWGWSDALSYTDLGVLFSYTFPVFTFSGAGGGIFQHTIPMQIYNAQGGGKLLHTIPMQTFLGLPARFYHRIPMQKFKAVGDGIGVQGVKSVIFDCADNWGDDLYMAIRSIEFLDIFDNIITLTEADGDFDAYATTYFSDYDYKPELAFDTSLSKTGAMDNRTWVADYDVTSDQRLIIVFSALQDFYKIQVNNSHDKGDYTIQGVKNVDIYTSDTTVTNTTYGADTSNYNHLGSFVFDEHVSSDTIDNQIITI